jgi:hypothetical protein
VKHQIESFNLFVSQQIPQTIDMFNPVPIRSEQDYVKEVDKYILEMFVMMIYLHYYIHLII